jgi:murein DD-endopeptidase MepM/ murein hydrolase activator NlpD
MAPGGTAVFAPEQATVWRLSGHDPAQGVIGGDIFGWNIYLYTPGGVIYFGTHFGDKHVTVGQKVKAGTLIGHVGHWPHDPGRSHTHLGVTHPMGKRAAVARINVVAKASMVPLL